MKSQYVYVRPDLGTVIYKYEDVDKLAESLGVELGQHNVTTEEKPPELSVDAALHVHNYFAWDFAQYN